MFKYKTLIIYSFNAVDFRTLKIIKIKIKKCKNKVKKYPAGKNGFIKVNKFLC